VQSVPKLQKLLSEPGPPSSQTPSEAVLHVSEQPEEAVFPEIEEDVIVTASPLPV
jgi:hypothetical protein